MFDVVFYSIFLETFRENSFPINLKSESHSLLSWTSALTNHPQNTQTLVSHLYNSDEEV